MVCDYFGEAAGPVCRARAESGLVVPTITEETRYCLTNRFCECVHWQNRNDSTQGSGIWWRKNRRGSGGSPRAAGA